MAASYPTTIKSFSAKSDGQVIYVSHITSLEEEVVAIETALKTGPTAMAAATFSSTVGVTGAITAAAASFSGAVTLTGGLNTPLVVAQGGTGLATLTNKSVLVGAGTGTVAGVAPSTSGNVLTSDGTDWASTAVASSDTGLVAEGRLTLTSGTPVTTADVTGATNIYFAPYGGNRIALYDGSSAWNIRTFTQITIALGTLTDAKPYDLFAYDNSGTVTFDSPVVWTNDTTRATALTTQDGVLVKSGATTRRYIGTFYTTATTTTEDSFAKRFLWNYYNRVSRPMRVVETATTWTYTTATLRQANASTANQLDLVVGVLEDMVEVDVIGYARSSIAAKDLSVSIGEDSTSSAVAGVVGQFRDGAAANAIAQATVSFVGFPAAVGRHIYVWLEMSEAAGTSTWYGVGGAGASDLPRKAGIFGSIQG